MKLNILFTVNSHKINQKGLCGITCRLTYLKQRKQFSTGISINPQFWKSRLQLVEPPEPDAELINQQLSLIKTKINRAFLMLQMEGNDFDVYDIYRLFKGEKSKKQHNIIEYFETFLNKLKKLINIDISEHTWKKYNHVKKQVKSFIKWQYKQPDFPLRELKLQFLKDMEFYFKTEMKLGQATINKAIQRFRKPIREAVAEGYLDKDPFMLYKSKRVKKEIVYLTPEELDKFEMHQFAQPRLELVQDLFVFSCYTGLAYKELMNLKKSNIVVGFDGNKWIKMGRQKTVKSFSLPLLPKAIELVDKYNNECDTIFPHISNQKYNSYLKEIAAIIGIDKRLATHVARKTFATTVLLFNGVSMEVTSQALGHSSIKITQDHYGEIVKSRMADEMKKIKGN